ncbi:MAG: alpha/beta hydrolase [Steroidobacteraceae bacterium]
MNAPLPRIAGIAAPLAAAAALALASACARQPAAAPPAASTAPGDAATAAAPSAGTSAAATAAPAAPAEPPEGVPRIVDAPDRVHIQYRVYGHGEPLVVLVHGWSCDSNYFAAQIDALKARYTVATVNLAGHGGSGANRSDWSMAAFGGDVAAVVGALKEHQRVVLVGHSMGGQVVLEAARLLGPRVIGVIGLDTLDDAGRPVLPAGERERLLAPFRADFIGATRDFVQRTLFRKDADPVLARRITDDMAQSPPEVGVASLAGLLSWDGASALRALPAPLVLIDSDLGPPADEARLRRLAAHGVRIVTMKGVGHFLMMEDPQRFNPLLLQEIDAFAKPR